MQLCSIHFSEEQILSMRLTGAEYSNPLHRLNLPCPFKMLVLHHSTIIKLLYYYDEVLGYFGDQDICCSWKVRINITPFSNGERLWPKYCNHVSVWKCINHIPGTDVISLHALWSDRWTILLSLWNNQHAGPHIPQVRAWIKAEVSRNNITCLFCIQNLSVWERTG